MSKANVEIIREMYKAFHAGDAEGALAHFDSGVVVDYTARADGGIGHGRDAVNAMTGRWLSAWDQWHEDVEEIRDLGTKVLVVARQRGRAKRSGIEVETRYAVLFETQSDKITRMTLYAKPTDALEAAGAPE